jgi:N utilization substance protein B
VSEAAAPAARWDERHRAREAAVRALYEAEIGHVPIADAIAHVVDPDDEDAVPLDPESQRFAARLAAGVWAARAALDAEIAPHSTNWRLERLAVVDHLVLWLAVHEWLAEPGTPPRVVLSEALELARAYSGDAAVRFVNGVLDAVYRRLRSEGRIID